jgi:hypothetical protein
LPLTHGEARTHCWRTGPVRALPKVFFRAAKPTREIFVKEQSHTTTRLPIPAANSAAESYSVFHAGPRV